MISFKDKKVREWLREAGVITTYTGFLGDSHTVVSENIHEVNDKLDLILDHLGLEYVPSETNESYLKVKESE